MNIWLVAGHCAWELDISADLCISLTRRWLCQLNYSISSLSSWLLLIKLSLALKDGVTSILFSQLMISTDITYKQWSRGRCLLLVRMVGIRDGFRYTIFFRGEACDRYLICSIDDWSDWFGNANMNIAPRYSCINPGIVSDLSWFLSLAKRRFLGIELVSFLAIWSFLEIE